MQRLLQQELYAKHRALFARRAFFVRFILEFAGRAESLFFKGSFLNLNRNITGG